MFADHLCRDAVLSVSLEINDSVLLSVSAAMMSDGDLALAVASGSLLLACKKGLLRSLLGDLCEIRTGHLSS